jgi:carbon storage regulator
MLVLKRNLGEDILIGTDIVVRLLESGDGHAKLGVTAPKEIPIHRREVAEAIETAVIVSQHEGPLEDDGGPVSPPILAQTEAFDHSQFEDGGTPPDLSKLGIFRPNQPR